MSAGENNQFLASANLLSTTGTLDPSIAVTELRLPDGRVLHLETSLLVSASRSTSPSASASVAVEAAGTTILPILEERLDISRRTIETGKVRLHKTVQEFEAVLDEPLAVRTYDIEHVLLNQPVETAPGVRTEGDTTIYPLVEEQLVLTKQLVLKEEIRVTRRDTERRDTQSVTLRREHLVVEREALK